MIFVDKKSDSSQESIITEFENIDSFFSAFVDEIFDVLDQEKFSKIQRKCLENLNVAGGLSLSESLEDKIDGAKDLGALFKIMCRHCKSHWNWMNIRIIEKMAGNSKPAKELIENYKAKIFSIKVKDVISEISDLEIPTETYTTVKEKLDKDFDELLVKDIVSRWKEIEKKLNVEETMLLQNVTPGCVEICWLLRKDLVDHAICSATKNQPVSHDDQPISCDDQPVSHDDQSTTQELFPEVLYLKIGEVVIKDDTTSRLYLYFQV